VTLVYTDHLTRRQRHIFVNKNCM